MTDNFGQYADAVQGASVSYLKSAPSNWRWKVSQTLLGRTILQFGVDGGAGIVHGVTDPNLLSVIMQITEFDDCVWLDGVPLASRVLVILPPETHFTFVRTGPEKWLSWSMRKDEILALRLQPSTQSRHAFKTEKHMVTLPMRAASAFRSIAHDVFGEGAGCSPGATIEDAMFHHLEQAWEKNDGIVALPSESTRSAEQIVFRALRFVQSKGDENVEIGDLAHVSQVNYRTLLRAFERYLKISPKRYLKLRQIMPCTMRSEEMVRVIRSLISLLKMAYLSSGDLPANIGLSLTNCRQLPISDKVQSPSAQLVQETTLQALYPLRSIVDQVQFRTKRGT
jgi:hypothetical protein